MKDIVYQRLVFMLGWFSNRPHLLAKLLIKNNIFTEDFKKFISSDKFAKESPDGNKDFDSMIKAYSASYFGVINTEIQNNKFDMAIKLLNNELKETLNDEDYEKASLINKWIKKLAE